MAYTITEAQAVELFKIAEAIVGKQIQSGMVSENDRDDYIQELILLMVQHQDEWTVPEGIRFESYANTVMEKRFWNLWRKNNITKDALTKAESLNETFVNDSGEEEEFIARLTECGILSNDAEISEYWSHTRLVSEIRLFILTLPKEERVLCKILLYHNKAEACRILGKHRQSLSRMVECIRTKMLLAGISPRHQKNLKKSCSECEVFAFKK